MRDIAALKARADDTTAKTLLGKLFQSEHADTKKERWKEVVLAKVTETEWRWLVRELR